MNNSKSSSGGDEVDTRADAALDAADLFTELNDDALFDTMSSESPGELEHAGEAAPPSRTRQPRGAVVTPAQIEMRRRRNRASMRRTRERKLLALDHLRQQIEVLERQLSDLRLAVDAETSAAGAVVPDDVTLSLLPPTRAHCNALSMRELRDMIATFQHEQMRLQSAVQSRQMLAVAMQQLVNEHEKTRVGVTKERAGEHHVEAHTNELGIHSNNTTSAINDDNDEAFLWVNAVLPLLPQITSAHADDAIVREIVLGLMQDMKIASAHQPSVDRMLGWSDARAVRDCCTDFAFSKDFVHTETEALAAKTWAALTHTHERSGLTSEQVHLKVLARISDNMLVMAKSVYYAAAQRHFCSIFVALRVQTANGFVVGRRTVRPLPQHAQLYKAALGDKRTHSDESCGFVLTHLEAPALAPAESVPMAMSEDATDGRGCSVTFAGRIRSETDAMAQNVATRVLLAALHWENTCVEPLRYLTRE